MFFENDELKKRKHTRLKLLPSVPDTGWRPPSSFPNLSAASVISLDCETKETDWERGGPGWGRGHGHIVGVSLAAVDRIGNRGKWYFPLRHEEEPQDNLDPSVVLPWLSSQLGGATPKAGANLIYDVGWLAAEGVAVGGELHDVQFAEALLTDDGETALDALGAKYCGEGKETSMLYRWCADAYGGAANGRQRGNIYRAPPRLVGAYAEQDADLPLRVLAAQGPILAAQGLWPVYRMECDLIPLLVEMRLQGVAVDVPRADALYGELSAIIAGLYADMSREYGRNITTVGSAPELAALFDANGIPYPKTEKGNPSFRKEFLNKLDHPVGHAIAKIREHEKIRDTFLKGYILNGHVNGVVHGQFHPLRSYDEDNDDTSGAKTGRFASSKPNLQNIPARTKLGNRVREIFIPFPGCFNWRKYDYSQIEYRMLANFAVDDGDGTAELLRRTYCENPHADYHDVVQAEVKRLTGILIERKPIKNINFGLLYGQGEKALAFKSGLTQQQARSVFDAYHLGAPYVKPTMQAIAEEANRQGYVVTLLGRRTRFDLWEPATRGDFGHAVSYDDAIRRYGSIIRRAYTYKAVNYKLQGSAADIMKAAMVALWKSGVFKVTGTPTLTVHDELDFSARDDSPAMREAWAYITHVLENTTPVRVPIKTECEIGPNWGEGVKLAA